MMNARFELFVQDLQKAVEFYENILGFTTSKRTEEYAGLRNGNVKIGIGLLPNLPSDHPLRLNDPDERTGVGVEFVLEVDDVTELYNNVQKIDYPINAPLEVRPWGLTDFRLLDPDGYYLRITSKA